MQTPLSQFQSHQLEVIARVTPHAMAGQILNTTVLAIAVQGSVPKAQLIGWCIPVGKLFDVMIASGRCSRIMRLMPSY